MYDTELLIERLRDVLEALERIPKRCAGIRTPSDFDDSDEGIEHKDSICMVLVAVGEELKSIDRKTDGKLLSRYPDAEWRGVMGVRDIIAHGYFKVNSEQLFDICGKDIPKLIDSVKQIIEDVQNGASSQLPGE